MKAQGFKGNQYTEIGIRQNDGKQTAKKLAETHGVSPRTVERAGAMAEVMKLAREMPHLLDDSNSRYTANLSIESALTYLTAPDEVKAEVDAKLDAGESALIAPSLTTQTATS